MFRLEDEHKGRWPKKDGNTTRIEYQFLSPLGLDISDQRAQTKGRNESKERDKLRLQ